MTTRRDPVDLRELATALSEDPLAGDLHVHSTYSDGKDTLAANIAAAQAAGLSALGLVDHVRSDTGWVPTFAADVERHRATTGLTLVCGVETKVLDTSGALDLPTASGALDGVDLVLVADHQLPTATGPLAPARARTLIASGDLDGSRVITDLLTATIASLDLDRPVLLAHLFSVLPKAGLSLADGPDHLLDDLVVACVRRRAWVEVSERWCCPSASVVDRFRAGGVTVVASTDSHRAATVGRYRWVAKALGSRPRALAPSVASES